MQIENVIIKDRVLTFTYNNDLFAKAYFVTENILRFQLSQKNSFSDEPTIMNDVDVPDEGDATVGTGGSGQHLKTKILLDGLENKIYPSEKTTNGLKTAQYELTLDLDKTRVEIFSQNNEKLFSNDGLPLKNEKGHLGLKLSSLPNEYFFGGGTQNGFVNLKGKKIQIENQNMWTEGGVASPVPFFFSTRGYGVLMNTFTKGSYSFHTPRSTYLQHEDEKLDAFIILGEKPETIIQGYYTLTGKPHLSPLYSYYPAHLNAYNRDFWVEVTKESDGAVLFSDGKYYKEYQPIREKTFNTGYRHGTITLNGQKLVPNISLTKDVTFIHPDETGMPKTGIQESLNGEKDNYQFSARAIIDRYKEQDLPLGWFLPNDGYGAGYGQTDSLDGDVENLKEFGEYAREKGVELGLWTQENIAPKDEKNPQKDERDLAKEVQVAGVTALKTDVAWVGEGYTFGLNGVSDAFAKMHQLSEKRPFIVTLDGWAGTQRYGSIWSGDQEGSDWQNVKFHIPTYLSTGLSGNPNVGGDIDGIFGGNDPVIQTRDLQWKSFTPIQLSMDGWGSKPKDLGAQFGDDILDINRFYLKIKTMLLPYFYSLAYEAREKGLPILRPTFMAEPNEFTYGSSLEYQFLLGESLLVAPIFEPYGQKENGDCKRQSVYLPKNTATWYDAFTGESLGSGKTLGDVDAPLWKLPLFVKAGGIFPLWNPTNQVKDVDYEKRHYLIYPSSKKTSFVVYEDDGLSNDFESGKYLTTLISQEKKENDLVITIHGAKGEGYSKMITERKTKVQIFLEDKPEKVFVNGKEVADWKYDDLHLPTFAPENSTSEFSKKKITLGQFLTVEISEKDIQETIEILVK